MKPTLRLLFWILACLTATVVQAQQAPWEGALHDVMSFDGVGETDWTEACELLEQMAAEPMDLNRATRHDLERLPFLTAQQVEGIVAYLDRYGPLRSVAELRMVDVLDPARLGLLRYFVTVADDSGEPAPRPGLRQLVRQARQELMVYGRVPFYTRKGDDDGYQGYPYKHWTRYRLASGDCLKAGLVGAQDAGEPFLAGRNGAGYDFYSYYVQLRGLGCLESAVAGQYRVTLGMGLVVNTGFSLGRMATLQNLGRQPVAVRPHASVSADGYFRGAAATVRLSPRLTATAFVSSRPLDATLNSDGTAATIVTGGYHRTPSEMGRKGNTDETAAGGHVEWRAGGLHLGGTLLYSQTSRPLRPNTSALYRRYYAAGSHFLNYGADYGFTRHRFSLTGETALSRNGAVATINVASVQLADGLSLMAMQRFYSYRYTARHARSFSDGGVQNESGLYLGATFRPSPRLRLQAYADYCYFPWARYQASRSSRAADVLASAAYSRSQWTLTASYRQRRQQRDNSDKTALDNRTEHRARLSLLWKPGPAVSSTTQLDLTAVDFRSDERGSLVSERLSWQALKGLRIDASAAYFDSDSYDSRLYYYEQSPLYASTFAAVSGRGLRGSLMAKNNLGRQLVLTAKIGVTRYLDRQVTGTGLQQVDGSTLCDLDLQVRWKF